jgi:hypothetical protein
MAVVETIRIEGDGSGFELTVNELNREVKDLNKNVKQVGTTTEKSFEKAEKAVEGVNTQVKETGKNIQGLIKNITALGVVTKLTDAASEAFTGNQKVVDVLNTGIFTVQIAVSNLIDYFTGGKKSLREAFSGVVDQAKELVELQKKSQLADVQRLANQLDFQKQAEIQRQLRDDELLSIDKRIEANNKVDEILKEQLKIEKDLIEIKVSAAKAEYDRLSNVENLVALEQANVELLDVEERIIGQKSEYLMNQRSLERERLDLQKQINEAKAIEAETTLQMNRTNAGLGVLGLQNAIQNERTLAEEEYKRYENGYNIRVDFLNKQVALYQALGLTENAQYQALLDERYQLDVEYFERNRDLANQRREFDLQSVSDAVQTTQQAIDSISAFYEASSSSDIQGIEARMQALEAQGKSESATYKALSAEREKLAKRDFEIQKRLSIAQAVVQGVEGVINAYATAQKSPLTGLFPAYPAIAAGAAAAFAASQVALISSQQYQSSGAGSYTSGAGTPSVPSQPAQFNIVGQGGANQLVEGIAGQFDRPIRAYVVSGEVISGAELDRRRIRTATFG